LKIFEKLILDRDIHHFTDNHILVKEQFGFQSDTSTDMDIFKLLNKILNVLNNKSFVGGVFCDRQKAFDCIDHEILLPKLKYYGETGIININ
jgi:hypothetical protein